MSKTIVKVEFSIYGSNFNPIDITEKLNIKPSLTYLKGDLVQSKKITRKETLWCIETEYDKVLDINDTLAKIMTLISGKEDILNEITKMNGTKMLFMIVIKIKNNEIPAVYFDKEFTEFAGKIGAEIGFDMYI